MTEDNLIFSTWLSPGKGLFVSEYGSSLGDVNSFKDVKEIADFLNRFGISVLYLDIFRDDVFIPRNKIKRLKEYFTDLGIEVRGGAALGTSAPSIAEPSIGKEGEDSGFLCWTSPITREGFRLIAQELAYNFDEVLFDDCMFSSCLCDRCLAQFNQKYGYNVDRDLFYWLFNRVGGLPPQVNKLMEDWIKFQIELYEYVAREYLIKPAREINPEMRINAKVPQWTEYFDLLGYNLDMLERVFDKIYIGTEIREDLRRYAYCGYATAQYVKDHYGYSEAYTWFDTIRAVSYGSYEDSMSAQTFIEQARLSAFANSKEIAMVMVGDLMHPTRKEVMDKLHSEAGGLQKVYQQIKGRKAKGLKFLKVRPAVACTWPHIDNSWVMNISPIRDNYIESIFGMMGIPLFIVSDYNNLDADDYVIITEHEIARVEDRKWDIVRFVKEGGHIILTSLAIDAILAGYLGQEGYEMLGIPAPKIKTSGVYSDSITTLVFSEGERMDVPYPLSAGPILDFQEETEIALSAIVGDKRIPLIFRRKFGEGEIIGLCLTYPHKQILLGYPEEARQCLRDIAFEGFGCGISSSVSNICLFFYKGGIICIENFNDKQVDIKLRLAPSFKIDKLSDIFTSEVISSQQGGEISVFPISIPANSYRMFTAFP